MYIFNINIYCICQVQQGHLSGSRRPKFNCRPQLTLLCEYIPQTLHPALPRPSKGVKFQPPGLFLVVEGSNFRPGRIQVVSLPSLKKSRHSNLQFSRQFQRFPNHHHSEKLWSSGYQFRPWTFELLPWWPQFAMCGSLVLSFTANIQTNMAPTIEPVVFNSDQKSRPDFVFKRIHIPLLNK